MQCSGGGAGGMGRKRRRGGGGSFSLNPSRCVDSSTGTRQNTFFFIKYFLFVIVFFAAPINLGFHPLHLHLGELRNFLVTVPFDFPCRESNY